MTINLLKCTICQGNWPQLIQLDNCQHKICPRCVNTKKKVCPICKLAFKHFKMVSQSDSKKIVPLEQPTVKQLEIKVEHQADSGKTDDRGNVSPITTEGVHIRRLSSINMSPSNGNFNDNALAGFTALVRPSTLKQSKQWKVLSSENNTPVVNVVDTEMMFKLATAEHNIILLQQENAELNEQMESLQKKYKQSLSDNLILKQEQEMHGEMRRFSSEVLNLNFIQELVEKEIRPLNFQMLCMGNLKTILESDLRNYQQLQFKDDVSDCVRQRQSLIFDMVKIKHQIVDENECYGITFLHQLQRLLSDDNYNSLSNQQALNLSYQMDSEFSVTQKQHFGIIGRMQLVNGYKQIRSENIILKMKLAQTKILQIDDIYAQMQKLKEKFAEDLITLRKQISKDLKNNSSNVKLTMEDLIVDQVLKKISQLKEADLVESNEDNNILIIEDVFNGFLSQFQIIKEADERIYELQKQLISQNCQFVELQNRNQELIAKFNQCSPELLLEKELTIKDYQNKLDQISDIINLKEPSFKELVSNITKLVSRNCEMIETEKQQKYQIEELQQHNQELLRKLKQVEHQIVDINLLLKQSEAKYNIKIFQLNQWFIAIFSSLKLDQTEIGSSSVELAINSINKLFYYQLDKQQQLENNQSDFNNTLTDLKQDILERDKIIYQLKEQQRQLKEEIILIAQQLQIPIELGSFNDGNGVSDSLFNMFDISTITTKIQNSNKNNDALKQQISYQEKELMVTASQKTELQNSYDTLQQQLSKIYNQIRSYKDSVGSNLEQDNCISEIGNFIEVQRNDILSQNSKISLLQQQLLNLQVDLVDQSQQTDFDQSVFSNECNQQNQELLIEQLNELASYLNIVIDDNQDSQYLVSIIKDRFIEQKQPEKIQLPNKSIEHSSLQSELNEELQTLYKSDTLNELLVSEITNLYPNVEKYNFTEQTCSLLTSIQQIVMLHTQQQMQRSIKALSNMQNIQSRLNILIDLVEHIIEQVVSKQLLDHQNLQSMNEFKDLQTQLVVAHSTIEEFKEKAFRTTTLEFANSTLKTQVEELQKQKSKQISSRQAERITEENSKLSLEIKQKQQELSKLYDTLKQKDEFIVLLKSQNQQNADKMLLKAAEEQKVQQFRQIFDQSLVMEHDITFITLLRYVFFKQENRDSCNQLVILANDMKEKIFAFQCQDNTIDERFRNITLFIQQIYNFYCSDFPLIDVQRFVKEYDLQFTQTKEYLFGAESRNELLKSYRILLSQNMKLKKDVSDLQKKLLLQSKDIKK